VVYEGLFRTQRVQVILNFIGEVKLPESKAVKKDHENSKTA
jgi:hypothetical protein